MTKETMKNYTFAIYPSTKKALISVKPDKLTWDEFFRQVVDKLKEEDNGHQETMEK